MSHFLPSSQDASAGVGGHRRTPIGQVVGRSSSAGHREHAIGRLPPQAEVCLAVAALTRWGFEDIARMGSRTGRRHGRRDSRHKDERLRASATSGNSWRERNRPASFSALWAAAALRSATSRPTSNAAGRAGILGAQKRQTILDQIEKDQRTPHFEKSRRSSNRAGPNTCRSASRRAGTCRTRWTGDVR